MDKKHVNRKLLLFMVGLFGILAISAIDYWQEKQWRLGKINELGAISRMYQNRLEETVSSRFHDIGSLAALFTLNPDTSPDEFAYFSSLLLKKSPPIRALQYADSTTRVTYVYPPKNNEITISSPMILINDPKRGPYVKKAINQKKASIQGPFDLRQGGTGVVVRDPLFKSGKFIGLIIGVYNVEDLIKEAFKGIDKDQVAIALAGPDGNIFFGENAGAEDYQRSVVTVADSEWTLSLAWEKNMLKPPVFTRALIWFLGCAFIISCLLIIQLTFGQAIQLERLVENRTNELSRSNQSLILEIAERKKSEAVLKQSEARFRQLAENIREVFWIVSQDWEDVIYISPGYEEVWGRPCANLYESPKEWMKSIDKDDLEKVTRYLNKISSGDMSEIIFPEYKINRPDGSVRWIEARGFPVRDESGEIYRIAGIAEDITEQKQSEAAIQTLVESTAGITGPNFFDRVVELICSWLNCEVAIVEELENETTVNALAMIADGEFKKDFSYHLSGSPCEAVKKEGFCYFPENIIALFPDAKYLEILHANCYVGTKILSRDGQLVGFLSAITRGKLDLTDRVQDVMKIIAARISAEIERKNNEIEKKQIEARLRQSQKMESIGTLAGGIAHDFNNILFPIMGYTEMLMEDYPDDDRIQDSLKEIHTGTLRARDLVRQILTFSRQDTDELNLIRLKPVIQEALKLIRATLPTTIDINQTFDPDCGVILADPTKIHQIVMNLATNAYHALEEKGGDLNISLTRVTFEDSDLKNHDIAPGVYVCLKVADTGTGMDKDLVKKIFDPFFTTKIKTKGTGMGLAVVHGIVAGMGGGIRVYSEPGLGTEVNVYFPVAHNVFESVPATSEKITGGTERILIVDDEKAIVKMEQQVLERLGYQVTAMTDSVDAIDLFKNNRDNFDLIITDMTMPNMTGVQFAQEIKSLRRDIPIILCTGFSNQIDRQTSKEIGISGFLLKPVVKRELAHTIRKIFDNPSTEKIDL